MIRAAPLGVKKRAKNDPNFDGVQLKSVGCPKNDGQNRSKNRSSLPAPLAASCSKGTRSLELFVPRFWGAELRRRGFSGCFSGLTWVD